MFFTLARISYFVVFIAYHQFFSRILVLTQRYAVKYVSIAASLFVNTDIFQAENNARVVNREIAQLVNDIRMENKRTFPRFPVENNRSERENTGAPPVRAIRDAIALACVYTACATRYKPPLRLLD